MGSWAEALDASLCAGGTLKVSRSRGNMRSHWRSVDCTGGGRSWALSCRGDNSSHGDGEGTDGGALGTKPGQYFDAEV